MFQLTQIWLEHSFSKRPERQQLEQEGIHGNQSCCTQLPRKGSRQHWSTQTGRELTERNQSHPHYQTHKQGLKYELRLASKHTGKPPVPDDLQVKMEKVAAVLRQKILKFLAKDKNKMDKN